MSYSDLQLALDALYHQVKSPPYDLLGLRTSSNGFYVNDRGRCVHVCFTPLLNVLQAVQLDSMVEREVNRRDEWKAKINEIMETHRWLVERLQRWRSHHDREAVEAAERQELFGRSQLPSNVINALDEEGQSLDRSNNVVSSLLESATASLGELATQREMLKGTQRRVLDMLTTLGVSSSTIRVIERRNVVDRAIVFGGMAVTTLCLYLLWRWVR